MLKKLAFAAASKLVLQPWFRQTRGFTLGVRVMVLDPAEGVFLVRHTYAPGWLFPGGGVERGETVAAAAVREIREEGGLIAEGEPELHGIFSNDAQFPGDHIVCFIQRTAGRQDWKPNLETAEARFFPLSQLPDGITGGTRRRIAEVTEGRPRTAHW